MTHKTRILPSVKISIIPVLFLFASIAYVIFTKGAEDVLTYAPVLLLAASAFAIILAKITTRRSYKAFYLGIVRSARQVGPAIPILLLIGTVSATWILSGLVPTLITYGLSILSENTFLIITCSVCAAISVLSGSSWATIATIGVAFLGIGKVMGYSDGWIAGAIISGAYFGDKISPLSDTTVLASTSCEVPLFTHIRYLTITTVPTMVIALAVFLIVGHTTTLNSVVSADETSAALAAIFNITPWLMIIPAVTGALIVFRVNTNITLIASSLLGLAFIFIFQPHIIPTLSDNSFIASLKILFTETNLNTGNELIDQLITTRGISGMLPTVYLVVCAGTFGGSMLGTGMLGSLTAAFCRVVSSPRKIVGSTIGTGLFLNAVTADQFLSIVILGNLYKSVFKKARLEPRLLSRTVEDSVSVTSVLIPWGSCGLTQATVLSVPTITYLPYCIFNWLTPIMSLTIVYLGFKIEGVSSRFKNMRAVRNQPDRV